MSEKKEEDIVLKVTGHWLDFLEKMWERAKLERSRLASVYHGRAGRLLHGDADEDWN